MSEGSVPFDVTRARRAGARLAAVQALFELEQSGRSVRAVIRDFMDDRLGLGPEGEPVEEADPDLFKSIVEGAATHQDAVDRAIAARLAEGWRLTRLDTISRAILRAAAAELIAHPHLSHAIIMDEYVSLAHDFFGDGGEPRFINGVLDAMARDLRPEP